MSERENQPVVSSEGASERAVTRAIPHDSAQTLAATIERLRARIVTDRWTPTTDALRSLFVGALLLSLVVGSHVARAGTVRMRLFALAGVLVAFVVPLVARVMIGRKSKGIARSLESVAATLGVNAVDRAIDAIELAERLEIDGAHEGVSPSLARLHASRAIARLPVDRLADAGKASGARLRFIALVAIGVSVVVAAVAPSRFIEGIDVALSRRGHAPLPIAWLQEVGVVVHPPSYLHREDMHGDGYGMLSVPHGSALVVRGAARHPGRHLVLLDDRHEVPFIDDGAGGVVAHWSADESGHLRVAARFGEVLVEDPNEWPLDVIEDEAPRVVLKGAPKTIELATAGPSIALEYDAYDDHGLREVHLVIRVGTKEERRVLAKLEGEPKHDRGGPVLKVRDPLIAQARTPIRVRIEARDNDPITGPKWGSSDEITLVPPVIGEADARRYEALMKQRDAVVDLLADAMTVDPHLDSVALTSRIEATGAALESALDETYEGARVPSRIALVLKGRLRKVREANTKEKATDATKKERPATLAAVEHLTIGLDESLRALGGRSTRDIAKQLVEVCDDAAGAIRALRMGGEAVVPEVAHERARVDIGAIDGGGRSMRRLGTLGRDLGEIVDADLRRVTRTMSVQPADLEHAELAMRDLAARMREPVPSLGGGSSSSGQGDSAKGNDDSIEDESEAEKQAGRAQSQIDELVKDHGAEVGEVDDILRDAEDPKASEGLAEEAKEHAKALREAVSKLPRRGATKRGSLEAGETSLREKAEGMADALDKLEVGDAKDRGDSALKAVDEARDAAWSSPGAQDAIEDAGREVKRTTDWLDDVLKKLRKEAGARASEKLKKAAPRERGLEGRAKEVSADHEGKSPLPSEVKDLVDEAREKMAQASSALEEGDGDKASETMRDAQKLLDRARQSANAESPSDSGEEGDKSQSGEKVEIPSADQHKGPESFRKRAVDGLSGGATSTKMKDAERRYLEGLIR